MQRNSEQMEEHVIQPLSKYKSFLVARAMCNVFNMLAEKVVAVVAGGCIRSVITNKPIKDIDIILEVTEQDKEEILLLADRFGYDVVELYNGMYETQPTCVGVYQLNRTGELSIEVVLVSCSWLERVKAHSTSCSQVCLYGNEVITTIAFKEFVQQGVIRHYRSSPQYAFKYEQRMRQYYPNHVHVVEE